MNLIEQANKLGIKVDGRWSPKRIQEEIDKAMAKQAQEVPQEEAQVNSATEGSDTPTAEDDAVAFVVNEVADKEDPKRFEKYKDAVLRQWHGQSPDLPVGERISRLRISARQHGNMDLFPRIGDILDLTDKERLHI